MEKRNLIILTAIVLLGAILRFSMLTFNPPSLNWDEVSHGYNAYSILKTGMDQWGQRFPLFNFRAYGDYPTTLNLYLTIPFIFLFGLDEFAIRFPHALLGTLTIISVYFLTLGITKKRSISLFTAFLASTGPWYVFTSRFVLQSNLSVFLLITSVALFVNRYKNKNFIPLSLASLFLTLFSYHTTRIFSPLFLLGTAIIYFKEINNKLVNLLIGLFVILSVYILISPAGSARGNVLFLVDQGAVNRIETARTNSKLPNIITKVIYNRPVYFAEQFSKNYITYFSPKFLFLNGGTQYQFSIPNWGLIYSISLPFFYIGLILLISKSIKDKNYRLLLLWLFLSPIPASLTNESYTVLRATTMLPVPEILIAMGFYFVMERLPKKFHMPATLLYGIVALGFLAGYLNNYFAIYRNNYSFAWQYGYKEVVEYVSENYGTYDKIIVTKKYGEPHEYFLFFLNYDPSKYLHDAQKISFFQSNWWWVDHFDKFWFVNDWQVKLNPPEVSSIQQNFVTESKQVIDCGGKRCLLVTSPNNYPPGWNKINTVNFLDGTPAFEMYANK